MPVSGVEELAGSPRVRFTRGGEATATRVFKCPWEDRVDFAIELFGGYDTAGGSLVYTAGAPFPGFPTLYCDDIDIQPFSENQAPHANAFSSGAGEEHNAYDYARITAIYKLQQDLSSAGGPTAPEGTYLTLEADASVDAFTVPGRSWRWYVNSADDGAVKTDVGVPIKIPMVNYRLTWDRTPVIPNDAIKNCIGRVNDATFLGWPIGCVMFDEPKIRGRFQPNGVQLWSLDYSFRAKALDSTASPGTTLDYSWSRFYREEAGTGSDANEHWLKIRVKNAHTPPYAEADFSTLFVIA